MLLDVDPHNSENSIFGLFPENFSVPSGGEWGVGRDFETALQLNRKQNSLGIISFDYKVLAGLMGHRDR